MVRCRGENAREVEGRGNQPTARCAKDGEFRRAQTTQRQRSWLPSLRRHSCRLFLPFSRFRSPREVGQLIPQDTPHTETKPTHIRYTFPFPNPRSSQGTKTNTLDRLKSRRMASTPSHTHTLAVLQTGMPDSQKRTYNAKRS